MAAPGPPSSDSSASSASSAARLLDACFGRPVDRPPVWMMRQAGRYLPEYREVRQKISFWELCRSSELAATVSLQPFTRFQPDGVIFFSDILVPVAAMGADVEFAERGPHLPHPIRTPADVDRLHAFDPSAEIGFTGQTLRYLRSEVGQRAAVLGFAGAPWTVASYLIEGGGSKSYPAIKEMMFRDPRTLKRLLDLLADVAADVLSYQIESGAQAVQLFDTWAGELEPGGLSPVGASRGGPFDLADSQERRTRDPLRERLRPPARGHGPVGRGRALDRLAGTPVRGTTARAERGAPGQPRPGRPPRHSRKRSGAELRRWSGRRADGGTSPTSVTASSPPRASIASRRSSMRYASPFRPKPNRPRARRERRPDSDRPASPLQRRGSPLYVVPDGPRLAGGSRRRRATKSC